MKSSKTVADQIFEIERFEVRFVAPDGSEASARRVEEYDYQRAARHNWTVARWRENRFAVLYPDFDVEVLDGDGDVCHVKTLLSTIRGTYKADDPEPHRAQAPTPPRRTPRPPPPAPRLPRRASPAAKVAPTIRTPSPHRPQRGPMTETGTKNHASFIWGLADLLRGPYKPPEYGKVILPLTVLRRLDCVLAPTKAAVLERAAKLRGRIDNIEPVLCAVSCQAFYNTSPLDFSRLLDDPAQIAGNLRGYIADFSPTALDIIEKFRFDEQITRLDQKDLLYQVIGKFAEIDFHPSALSNLEMGYIYEELIRRFAELSNEQAGDHFTPREVIRLMVNVLLVEDDDMLTGPGVVRTLLDPACGTGGMLSVAEDHVRSLNPTARLEVFGQDWNDETYAICKSDMMIKGQNPSHIFPNSSFSDDGHEGMTFDYLLANPPFGVKWEQDETYIRREAEKGFAGRFGAGLPRINDGSFLFLQHMIHHMKPPEAGGSRLAIVFNGSPLFSGGAGSGESEIRRWIIENDWLEAIVALPDQLFYNTGIWTYFWVVTNRKRPERHGKIQLIDARKFWVKMRKSLGDKRKEIGAEQIADITRLYSDFTESDNVKIFPNTAFGFQRITVERPLRLRWEVTENTIVALHETKQWPKLTADDQADINRRLRMLVGQSTTNRKDLAKQLGAVPKPIEKPLWGLLGVFDADAPAIINSNGEAEADSDLRDNENVALPNIPVTWDADPADRLATADYRTAVSDFMATEVTPYVPDAWLDYRKTKIGYEIPLTRHFYRFVPPRPLAEIDTEIKTLETEIQALLNDVTE